MNRKFIGIIVLLGLMFTLSSGLGFAQSGAAQSGEITVVLEKEAERFPIFLNQPEGNVVTVCGLEPGNMYHIIGSIDEPGGKTSFIFDPVDPDQKILDDGKGGVFVKAFESCLSLNLDVNGWTYGNEIEWFYLTVAPAEGKPKAPSPNRSLMVDQNYTAQELVEDIFIGGSCFDVQNIIPIGPDAGRGYFTGASALFGFDDGVILATGTATNCEGPNTGEGVGNAIGGGSDADLQSLASFSTFDAVGLEFDFTPTVDQISFEFVFGSEEYCEWVNTQYNDVFGFFISGPGINGVYSNNAINLATVPNNGSPISIKSINTIANSGFFNPNANSCGGFTNPNDIEYDGYTITMVAVADVIPCETYHIKLVIADGSDAILDSGVFLKANSFNAGGTAGVELAPPISSGGIFYEDCDEGFLIFSRETNIDLELPLDIFFTISPFSTATAGADYTPLVPPLTIPPFQDTIMIPLNIINDGITEGQETIILRMENSCSCLNDSVVIVINDVPELIAEVEDVTVCGDDPASLSVTAMGGVGMEYEYMWQDGQTGTSVTLDNPQAGPYSVTVTDECGQDEVATAMITVVQPPEGTAILEGNDFVCNGSPSTYIQLDLIGEPPFTISYTLDGFPMPPIQTAVTPYAFEVSTPGLYTFTIIVDNTGCVGEMEGEILINEVIMESLLIGNDASCPEVNDGWVESVTLTGTPPYDYAWSEGSIGTPSIYGLPAGTYTVTVTDAFGCFGEESIDIDVGEAPEPLIQILQEVSCIGDDGIVLASAPNQPIFANLFYEWSNGANTDQNSGLTGGTYIVTVTEASGCFGIDTITLDPPESFNTDAQGFGLATCFQPFAGTADVEATDGLEPYSFEWSTGDTIQNPAGLGAGFHYVTVTDADGCREFDTVFIQSDQVIPDLSILTPDSIDCLSPSVVLDASGSSQGPEFTFIWTTANGTILSGASTPIATVGSDGLYTLQIIDESNGCDTVASVPVDDLTFIPQVSISQSDILNCSVTELTLPTSVNALGSDLDIQWSTTGGQFVAGTDSLDPIVNAPGLYEVTIVDQLNGCVGTATVTIGQDIVAPIASAGPDDVLNCNVSSVFLDGSGSSQGPEFSYQWFSPDGNLIDGDSTLNPEIASNGLYILQVTDTDNGCVSTDSVLISLSLEVPNSNAGVDTLVTCAITQVQLDGSLSDQGGNLTYQWTTPDGNIVSGADGLTPLVDQPGDYQLLVTNLDNGCSSIDIVTVDIDTTSPLAIAGPNQILDCGVTSLSLNGTASDSGPQYVYNWTTVGGNIVSGGATTEPVIDNEGLYILEVLNTDNGCSASDETNVGLDADIPLADAGAPDTLTCAIPELNLNATASTGPEIIYEWITVDGNILSGGNSLSPLVNAAGTYVLSVTDTSNGCQNLEEVVISIDTLAPVADAGPPSEINCDQPIYQLDGSGSSIGTDFIYLWTTSDGSLIDDPGLLQPSVDSGGTYQVLVTNTDNGCSSTAEVTIGQNYSIPVAVAGPGAELNCLLLEYTLDATGASSSPSIIYEWSTSDGNILSGTNTINPVVDEPGTYTILVLDTANGCSSTASVVITQDANQPISDAGPQQTLTCDVTSLSLNGTASSVGPQYSYNWVTSNGNIVSGGNTLTPEIDQPGLYQLEVFDQSNNCTVISAVEILQDIQAPNIGIALPETLSCVVLQTQIDASGSSSGTDFSYEWQTTNGELVAGSTTLQPTVASPGLYTLVVTNTDNGCTSTSSIAVEEDITDPDVAVSVPGLLTCAIQDLVISALGTSQGSEFTYLWSTADGQLLSPPSTFSPVVGDPGTYELLVTNTINGCTSVATAVVGEDVEVPQLSITGPDLLTCDILSVDLTVGISSSNPDFTEVWTNPDGIDVGFGPDLTVSEPGTYTVTVEDDFNGCINTQTFTVNQDTVSPTAEAGPTGLLNCEVTTLQLNGSQSSSGALYAYNWSTPDGSILNGQTTLLPTIDDPGQYTLLVTNTFTGCTSTDVVQIDEDVVPPAVDAGPEPVLTCADPTLTLSATASAPAPLSYAWSTQGGQIVSGQNALIPVVSEPGLYILTVTNQENKCQSVDSVIVNQNIIPPSIQIGLSGGNQLDCDTETLTLVGTGSSGQGQISYAWSTTNGNFVSGTSSGTPVIDAPGIYELVITDSENGCTTVGDITITQDLTPPVVVIQPPSILTCAVTEVSIDASSSSSGSAFAYDWFTLNGNIVSGGTTAQPVVDEPGQYTLVVTNTENGCSTTGVIEVDQDIQAPVAAGFATNVLDCVIEQVGINATGSSAGASFVYQWSTVDGVIVSGETSLNPVVSEAGIYTLVVTNTVNGCTSSTDVLVRRDPNVPEAMNFDVRNLICHGDLADFSVIEVIGGTPPYLYALDNGPLTAENIFRDLQPGEYMITVQDANGCELTETLIIEDVPEMSLSLPEDIQLVLGDGAQGTRIIAQMNPPVDSTYEVIWSPTDFLIFDGNPLAPLISDSIYGTVNYNLTIINRWGCLVSDDILVHVEKPREVFIPNVFSPNNDGNNDFVWISGGRDVERVISFLIFNRWGEKVYEVRNFDPRTFDPANGWDGSFRGQQANPAVYVYVAEIEFIDGEILIYKGDITLVR